MVPSKALLLMPCALPISQILAFYSTVVNKPDDLSFAHRTQCPWFLKTNFHWWDHKTISYFTAEACTVFWGGYMVKILLTFVDLMTNCVDWQHLAIQLFTTFYPAFLPFLPFLPCLSRTEYSLFNTLCTIDDEREPLQLYSVQIVELFSHVTLGEVHFTSCLLWYSIKLLTFFKLVWYVLKHSTRCFYMYGLFYHSHLSGCQMFVCLNEFDILLFSGGVAEKWGAPELWWW